MAAPHVYELDGKRILAFYIPECPRNKKPVYLNGNTRDCYIRRAAGDERVTTIELQRFLRDAAERSWDAESLPDFNVDKDLETETISWYQSQFYRRNPEQRQIDDSVEFLLEWNFVVEEQGQYLMTRAAALLFGVDRCVRRLLPRPVLDYQRIDARFELWSADERWHDRLTFEENLFKTWRGLVAKYVRVAEHPFSVDPATLRRNDDPPDYIAFREAAINLLIHQDYGDINRKASLKMFTDQTLFWNPGDAFASREELLQSTEKEIRNPLLVNAFRRIGLSDQAGTGIRAIYRNWYELGRRTPQIINDKAGKSFEMVLSKEPLINESMRRFQAGLGVQLSPEQADILALAANQAKLSSVDAGMAIGGNHRAAKDALDYLVHQQLLQSIDSDNYEMAELIKKRLGTPAGQVSGQVAGQVEDWKIEVLKACIQPRKSKSIQDIVGIKHRETFQRNYLDTLLQDGLLVRTIPDKPQSRLQSYKITEKGRALLAAIQ
jgi:ATP-dependent DNA helicase RecG